VIDEMIFAFMHGSEMDWMLPMFLPPAGGLKYRCWSSSN
jgi:hypothetical protein